VAETAEDVKRSDLDTVTMLRLIAGKPDGWHGWTMGYLESQLPGVPSKVILAKLYQLGTQDLVDWGIAAPGCWLTGAGRQKLAEDDAALVSLWRVQLLPFGEVGYHDRTLNFDRAYLGHILKSYAAMVYDMVPFMLAGADGAHTSDPQRWGGEVQRLQVVDDGLDAVIAATRRGGETIRTTPGYAAAPRLISDYRAADGKVHPVVLQHVLGTTKPLIPGLRAWEEMDEAPE
jgi:hypothetical protein